MAKLMQLPNPGKTAALRQINLREFGGGIYTSTDSLDVPDGHVRNALNVDFDRDGGFSRRKAVDCQIAAVGTSTEGAAYYSSKDYVVTAGSGPDLRYTDASAGAAWTTVTGTVSGTVAAITRYSSAEFNGSFYWCGDGAFRARRWDGSSGSSVNLTTSATAAWQDDFATPSGSHMPLSKVMCAHNSMMFVGATTENGTAFPNRVRWSHPGDAGSWRESDYIDVIDGGAYVMGIASFREVLLVFKQRAVYAITGYDADDFQVVKVADMGLGGSTFNARKHFNVNELGAFFVNSITGVWKLDASFQLTNVSANIRGFFQGLSSTSRSWDMAFGGDDERRLYVAVTSATFAGETINLLVWDPALDAWTFWFVSGYSPGDSMLLSVDAGSTSVPRISWDGRLIKFEQSGVADDVTGSATTHIDGFILTNWMHGNKPIVRKTWKRPEVIYRASGAGDFTMTSYVDYVDTADKTMTMSQAGSSLNYEVDKLQSLGPARAVSIKFAGPTAQNVTWAVDDITLKFREKPLRS